MLESIKLMLCNFEKENIIYCHWKSNEHLNESLQGDTDLDILFLPYQRSKIENVLSNSGLKRFRATPLMQYNAIEDYIGYDENEAKIWHLHIHYNLTLGENHLKGYTLPWGKEILENRKYDQRGIYVSDTSDELFLLYIRMSLKLRWRDIFKNLSDADKLELKWLKERVSEIDFEKRISHFVNNSVKKEILYLNENEITKKRNLKNLQILLRDMLVYYTGYNLISSYCCRLKRELFWFFGGISRRFNLNSVKPNRRVSPSGGTVVAILGCDGAGKSTTLNYLKKEFNKKIDVYCEYLGSGDGSCSVLRKPMKFIAKKIGGKGIGYNIEQKTNGNRSIKHKLYKLCKILWAIALALEKKGKLKKITKARNRGMLVLIDRYPQSKFKNYSDGPLLADYKDNRILSIISEWELNIYNSFYINPPDLLIKLDLPTSLAIKRKPEMTSNEIENKKRAIKAMHYNCTEVIIDTSENIKNTLSIAMTKIWEQI